ncbi:Molybdopterin-dependent oxidoreductase [Paraburkholderia tropica]|uniref:molybdopterin-dependent oxidoreductase n=1 Tax=Paraburkholderia tropica TaxID=92647 RepID=UPI001CAE3FF2|nr:molybdopterin-dependent oxidoreductase [Paraburkholderia tropica]CAG9221587.1 Molybdopterin-dependent oxidoreductase [Paraburkholderia tropica]
MNKRQFLSGAAAFGVASSAFAGKHETNNAGHADAPAVLTISGDIDRHNRGGVDVLDRLFEKQLVEFANAYAFDFPSLMRLPAVTIRPTLEYDAKPHTLSGPLLGDVLRVAGASSSASAQVMLRAIDGYAVMVSLENLRAWRYIVATHLDGKPMPLGGLGPLWVVYDADRVPEQASKPLKERFVTCPWAVYHVQVKAG